MSDGLLGVGAAANAPPQPQHLFQQQQQPQAPVPGMLPTGIMSTLGALPYGAVTPALYPAPHSHDGGGAR